MRLDQFKDLLDGDELAGVILLAGRVKQVVVDNKTPFFPDYTDHGIEHLEGVLEATSKLLPEQVRNDRSLFTSTDAATYVGAVLLHDIGMHLREPGFLELVSPSSIHRPLPWYCEQQGTRPPDQPWHLLWDQFKAEARHWSGVKLDSILGSQHQGVPSIAFERHDQHPDRWVEADRLLVGEFLRRHHARLAHEIAVYGFPGALELFPPLTELHADSVGVVARSHGEDLRIAMDYLAWDSPGVKRPHGAVLPYLMALLRIADYLQIEADRAPPLLLTLRDPQSRTSIDEWNKHGAVAKVVWDDDDPQALSVEVKPTHGLRTHAQLRELVAGLQRELDTTGAVLREQYPHGALSQLRISRLRVRSNLFAPSLHTRMTYVPRIARFHGGDDLFRLLVTELYGRHPVVGGRELVQNAVDAVRERRRFEATTGTTVDEADMYRQEADVLVCLHQHADGSATFQITDRGVGMSPDVIADFFLTVGASFGPAPEDMEHLSPELATRWVKTGRFGIGAMAAFLIGGQLRVSTRHVTQARGISFQARLDSEVVELSWDDEVPTGTRIEIDIAADSPIFDQPVGRRPTISPREAFLRETARFYQLQSPTLRIQIHDEHRVVFDDPRTGFVPAPGPELSGSAWRAVDVDELDAVIWTWARPDTDEPFALGTPLANFAHNGIEIRSPESPSPFDEQGYLSRSAEIGTNLELPYVAVFDSKHRTGINLTRYQLQSPYLPFEPELNHSIGLDIAAHALVAGPQRFPYSRTEALAPLVGTDDWFPLVRSLSARYLRPDDYVAVIRYRIHDQGLNQRSAEQLAQHLLDTAGLEGLRCVVLEDPPTGTTASAFDELGVRVADSPGVALLLGALDEFPGRVRPTLEHERSAASEVIAAGAASSFKRHATSPSPVGVSLWQRTAADGATADGALAAAWHDAVGGPMPLHAGDREQRAEAAAAASPVLRGLMEFWRNRLR